MFEKKKKIPKWPIFFGQYLPKITTFLGLHAANPPSYIKWWDLTLVWGSSQIKHWPKRIRRLFNSLYLIKEQRKDLLSLKLLLSLLLSLALVGFFFQILYLLLVDAFKTRWLFHTVFCILFYICYILSAT